MKHLLLTTIAAVLLVGCGNPDGALSEAAKAGNIEAAKQAIASGADVNATDRIGRTPLDVAISRDHTEIVELLITKGADVNVKGGQWGETPLCHEAYRGHKEIVELLIAAGADVNASDENGVTPLYRAAEGGHKEVAEILIDNGANVKGGQWPVTPLRVAISRDHTEIVELLITKGADVNAKDGNGWTPLHSAARGNDKEIAELLIRGGAYVNTKDNLGYTVLDWAVYSPETADLLRKHGGKTEEELEAAGK